MLFRSRERHRQSRRPNRGSAATAIDRLFDLLLDDPLYVSFDRADLISGAVAAGILVLFVLYQVGGRKNTRPGEEHGSAAWAVPNDITPLSSKDPTRRIQLTATEALSIDTRSTGRNLNVCVLGASGTEIGRAHV